MTLGGAGLAAANQFGNFSCILLSPIDVNVLVTQVWNVAKSKHDLDVLVHGRLPCSRTSRLASLPAQMGL